MSFLTVGVDPAFCTSGGKNFTDFDLRILSQLLKALAFFVLGLRNHDSFGISKSVTCRIKCNSEEPFPRVRKAARGNPFEAIHGGATRPSRRRGEMLDAGKRVNLMFARARRASHSSRARVPLAKSGDHPEPSTGVESVGPPIFCAVACRL